MKTHVKVFAAGMMAAMVAVGVAQAESRAVSAQSNFELKAAAKRVQAGDLVSVDVYLKNVTDVAVYQVQVAATGGR